MYKLLVPIIITSLSFTSCEQKIQQSTESEIALVDESNDEDIIRNESEAIAATEHEEHGKIHIDTVTFIGASYDYDYWFMDTQKNSGTLVFQIDDVYEFTKGDELAVKWRVDSVPFEGDGGAMYRSNQAISIKKLNLPN